jgi:hypothetical protein
MGWRTNVDAVGLELDAIQQGDEADEGRLVARRSMVVGGHLGWPAIVSEGAGARPSQLIASVGLTRC